MKHIDLLIERYPALIACRSAIEAACDTLIAMYRNDGKVLLCGNGGSAADSEHISGELLKGFLSKRPLMPEEVSALDPMIREKLQRGIAAVPLTSLSAISTAFSNDVDPDLVFAQLVFALGRKHDVFWGMSTSGNAKNVAAAAKTAKEMGMVTIGLTGASGGKLAEICDITVKAPASETYQIQELHLPIYHAICAEVEEVLFGGEK